ncbi:MAG: hypothetical protein ABTQ29_10335 [Siculibacillus sp.]
MAPHVVARRIAPFIGAPIAVIAGLAMETPIRSILVGFGTFIAIVWIGDAIWKARASEEEIRRDLEERARDFP